MTTHTMLWTREAIGWTWIMGLSIQLHGQTDVLISRKVEYFDKHTTINNLRMAIRLTVRLETFESREDNQLDVFLNIIDACTENYEYYKIESARSQFCKSRNHRNHLLAEMWAKHPISDFPRFSSTKTVIQWLSEISRSEINCILNDRVVNVFECVRYACKQVNEHELNFDISSHETQSFSKLISVLFSQKPAVKRQAICLNIFYQLTAHIDTNWEPPAKLQ